MKHLYWMVILTVILTSCNLDAVTPTATPLSAPKTDTPQPVSPTPTLVPIETLLAQDTPTAIPIATSRVILASPNDQPVNCRFGPDISYAVVGALIVGRQAEVIGKSIDVTWWYVRNPSDPSTNCWLSADFVAIVGNVEALPVVSPPEIGVTNIQVQVDPVAMNVGCDAFPQTVSVTAQITANGPTIITWKWETSAADVFAEEILLFESEGTKEARTILTLWSANDYWVNLHVLIPNDRSEGANFKVTCVP
ncbi:MAG TPA: SH3 domain-containing protein [Anaerolineales bacterium]|nr:SH3 domain-containing protein [Anaerolineales bacterium]